MFISIAQAASEAPSGNSLGFGSSIGSGNVVDFITTLLAYGILIAVILSVFFIFYGGIAFILSGGKDDKIKSAVNIIRYSIIGLMITFLSIGIISIVGRIFNIDLVKYIRFERIMQTVSDITSRLVGSDTTTPAGTTTSTPANNDLNSLNTSK